MIAIENVDKVYNPDSRESVEALRNINLTVEDNEFVSLIGPSGCGKTTLLKCIGDILTPTGGAIYINEDSPESARKSNRIAFFFQEDVLLPWRTVMENVLLPLQIQNEDIKSEDVREQAQEVINTVGLGGFEKHKPAELSGGMRERVALARGWVYNPDIFLMDEPFSALDELTRREMNGELLRIHAEIKKTTVFVTHHIPEAVWLSDRVVVLSPRPGEIHDIIDIDLPRPRDDVTRQTEEFHEHEEHLTNLVMGMT